MTVRERLESVRPGLCEIHCWVIPILQDVPCRDSPALLGQPRLLPEPQSVWAVLGGLVVGGQGPQHPLHGHHPASRLQCLIHNKYAFAS